MPATQTSEPQLRSALIDAWLNGYGAREFNPKLQARAERYADAALTSFAATDGGASARHNAFTDAWLDGYFGGGDRDNDPTARTRAEHYAQTKQAANRTTRAWIPGEPPCTSMPDLAVEEIDDDDGLPHGMPRLLLCPECKGRASWNYDMWSCEADGCEFEVRPDQFSVHDHTRLDDRPTLFAVAIEAPWTDTVEEAAALERLEADGLLRHGNPDRDESAYELTAKGRHSLAQAIEASEGSEHANDAPPPMRGGEGIDIELGFELVADHEEFGGPAPWSQWLRHHGWTSEDDGEMWRHKSLPDRIFSESDASEITKAAQLPSIQAELRPPVTSEHGDPRFASLREQCEAEASRLRARGEQADMAEAAGWEGAGRLIAPFGREPEPVTSEQEGGDAAWTKRVESLCSAWLAEAHDVVPVFGGWEDQEGDHVGNGDALTMAVAASSWETMSETGAEIVAAAKAILESAAAAPSPSSNTEG